jgi:hypothetical protein
MSPKTGKNHIGDVRDIGHKTAKSGDFAERAKRKKPF